ncbi:MAG: hypothetical protein Q4B67_01005 [Eubacteriales bacterium]|nr:hypothetical protein [Eubacteriales bacterium]
MNFNTLKRALRTMVSVIGIVALISVNAFAAGSVGLGPGSGMKKLTLSGYEVPENAEVVIYLKSNNEETNATGSLSIYTKTDGLWYLKESGIKAHMGRKGMGKVKEGDQKTPLGMWTMDTPFGIKDKEEGFPDNYLKVTEDLYWVGDTSSSLYNKLVSTKKYDNFSKKQSEHLSEYKGYYDYGINMGYNSECKSPAGSALFLHCMVEDQFTGGCVAIPTEKMKEILKLYKEGKTVMIVV